MRAGSPKPIVGAVLLAEIFVAAGTLGCTESLPVTTAGSKSPVKVISPTAAEPQLPDTQLTEQLTVTEPSPSNPVVAAMKFNPPRTMPGGATELLIYFRFIVSVKTGPPTGPRNRSPSIKKSVQNKRPF